MSRFDVTWLGASSAISAGIVQRAVEGFVEKHGVPPAGAAVHPAQVSAMEKAIREMLDGNLVELTSLAVRPQGGMLVTEFWMEEPRSPEAAHE